MTPRLCKTTDQFQPGIMPRTTETMMAWRDIFERGRLGGDVVALLDRQPVKPLAAVDTDVMQSDHTADYRRTCESIGVDDRDISVEGFRAFLAKHDMPTFNLQEVISYMDDLTARDNPTKLGWNWCPVRPKDTDVPMHFGRLSREAGPPQPWNGVTWPTPHVAASDYYESHDFRSSNSSGLSSGTERLILEPRWDPSIHRSPHYTRTLPLHALKKIAFVEKEWRGTQVVFLVTDYTLAPHVKTAPKREVNVNPDPFLMAVIPNSAVAFGKGRFVIDVWDEPGFGIEQMLK